MNHSFKIAFCGIMTALALVCMFVGQLVPVAVYTCALISGVCIALVAEKIDIGYATSVYAAASILVLLLIPDKEAAVIFITVVGYYPIYKKLVERSRKNFLKSNTAKLIMKLIFINICCVIYFVVTIYILGVPKDSFAIGDVYLPGIFLIMGNIICLMYDKALDNLIILYKYRFRKNIFRKW